MENANDTASAFLELVGIIARLRNPNGGCPWDLEQTHESLKPYVIEEAFEVVEAIDAGPLKLRDELGDLLIQVLLHAQIGSDAGTFSIVDVLKGVTRKLIERHPHVFGDAEVKNTKEVLKNWEQIKKEKLKDGESILDGVPRGMPALLRGQRVGEKAARVGFEWHTVRDVHAKVLEEIHELTKALETEDGKQVEEEFGDVLFALTQLSRRLQLNAEELLHRAVDKFTRRFKELERRAGRDLKSMSLEELDAIWEQVKSDERGARAS